MQEYMEKRDFPRMTMDSPARYREDGGSAVVSALVKDLSSGGLMLQSEQSHETGSRLAVEIRPGKNITPPLHALVTVNRCEELAGESQRFNLACTIDRMLPEDEVPLDFP